MKRVSVFLLVLVLAKITNATTVTIIANTNWTAAGISSGDAVLVKNGAILTVNSTTAQCASLQLGDNTNPDKGHGTLSFSASDSKLTVSGILTLGDGGKNANFDFGSGGTLVIGGIANNSFGSCTCTNGTIELTATATLPSGTFPTLYNLTITSGTFTLGRDVTISKNLIIGSGATFLTNNKDIEINGDWTNNGGTFTPGTGQIKFNSGGTQSITETNSLYKIKIQGGTVLNFMNSITVTKTVALAVGKINLGTFNLSIPAAGDITSESSTDYVIATGIGTIIKTYDASNKNFSFPVGDATNYSPVTIKFTSASTYGTIAINVTDGDHPALNTSGTSYISRWWQINGVGFTSFDYKFDAKYVDGDIVGTESNIYAALYSGGAWYSGKQAEHDAANTLSKDNNTTFSNIGGGDGSSLPIKLIYFKAEKDMSDVKLEWSTSVEVNNDYFLIERTSDGENFELIGKVKGAGNSNGILNYSLNDTKPIEGTSYYRLKQTDFDGKYEYFEMVAVQLDKVEESTCVITIYPNPCSSTCTVNVADCPHDNKNDINVEVFDAMGNRVKSKLPIKSSDGKSASFYMDTNNALAPGIFVIRASNNVKESAGKMIIK